MSPQRRQQLLAALAIGAVAIFALDKLVLTPLTKSWKERNTLIAQLQKDLQTGKQIVEREQITRSRWNDIRKSTLPKSASHAEQEMLQSFERWSESSRISISSIKPQLKPGATEDYSVLECRVDAAGTLPTIVQFLHLVESSPLALRIEVLELTTRDPTGQQITLGLLVSGLRLAPVEKRS